MIVLSALLQREMIHKYLKVLAALSTLLFVIYSISRMDEGSLMFSEISRKILSTNEEIKRTKLPDKNISNANILLDDGKNIFFVETGDSNFNVVLTARQACAIESAAKMNPHLRVYLLYCDLDRFKSLKNSSELDAIRSYTNVHILHVNMTQLAIGTPMEEFMSSDQLSESHFKLPHTSDALRLLLLWKFSGTYIDTDMIVRMRLDSISSNFACRESTSYMNGAILNFDGSADKKLEEIFIKMFIDNFDGSLYSKNGPLLITSVVKHLCNVTNLEQIKTEDCQGFHVLPSVACYPVSWENWEQLLSPYYAEEVMKTVSNSLVVHFWNKFSKNQRIKIKSQAPYAQLAREFCPRVVRRLRKYF